VNPQFLKDYLIDFEIAAALVGFVAATIIGFLIWQDKRKPVRKK
jgi:hypothetical protein